jgi:hypothetical protein
METCPRYAAIIRGTEKAYKENLERKCTTELCKQIAGPEVLHRL